MYQGLLGGLYNFDDDPKRSNLYNKTVRKIAAPTTDSNLDDLCALWVNIDTSLLNMLTVPK
jgi:hypothetical protein